MKKLRQYIQKIIKESFEEAQTTYEENRRIYQKAIETADQRYFTAHMGAVAAWGALLYMSYSSAGEGNLSDDEALDLMLDAFAEVGREIRNGSDEWYNWDWDWIWNDGLGKSQLTNWFRKLQQKVPLEGDLIINRTGIEAPNQIASYTVGDPYGESAAAMDAGSSDVRWYRLPAGTGIIVGHGLADDDEVIGVFTAAELKAWRIK